MLKKKIYTFNKFIKHIFFFHLLISFFRKTIETLVLFRVDDKKKNRIFTLRCYLQILKRSNVHFFSFFFLIN